MRRWIMHVDMDAFFASVEQRDTPAYRGRPVIVGGLSRRGVVATASYEARAFGVHSAMPVAKARELCPAGIFLPPRFDAYKEASDTIHQVMLRYADAYEPISLDEAFLDVSAMGEKFPTLNAMGRSIKKDIYDAVNLVASVGIAPNKFLAKMASDMDKPDGLTIIPYGKEKEILAPLPVRRLWGVGPMTEKKLLAAGYRTITDVQRAREADLILLFGSKQGHELHELAFGRDSRPIVATRDIKSISDESTYEEDLTDRKRIVQEIRSHSAVVAGRLAKHHLYARTISLKIRFSPFRTVQRSLSRESGTDSAEDIAALAESLLARIPLTAGVRLIGVTAEHLTAKQGMDDLFSERNLKLNRAGEAVARIQARFGKDAIRQGVDE